MLNCRIVEHLESRILLFDEPERSVCLWLRVVTAIFIGTVNQLNDSNRSTGHKKRLPQKEIACNIVGTVKTYLSSLPSILSFKAASASRSPSVDFSPPLLTSLTAFEEPFLPPEDFLVVGLSSPSSKVRR